MALPATFEIELGEEKVELEYAFLAFDELGLNPFKPAESAQFLGVDEKGRINMANMDARKAAMWVRAGMKHLYVEEGARDGQQMPSVDWVLRRLTMEEFGRAFGLSLVVAGLKSENGDGPAESGDADPPTA